MPTFNDPQEKTYFGNIVGKEENASNHTKDKGHHFSNIKICCLQIL